MSYRSEYFWARPWGTEHEVQDFSGGGAAEVGVVVDQSDVVEFSARVLGAVAVKIKNK